MQLISYNLIFKWRKKCQMILGVYATLLSCSIPLDRICRHVSIMFFNLLRSFSLSIKLDVRSTNLLFMVIYPFYSKDIMVSVLTFGCIS